MFAWRGVSRLLLPISLCALIVIHPDAGRAETKRSAVEKFELAPLLIESPTAEEQPTGCNCLVDLTTSDALSKIEGIFDAAEEKRFDVNPDKSLVVGNRGVLYLEKERPGRAHETNGCSAILSCEPNFKRYLSLVPNDPNFVYQWHLRNTGQVLQGGYVGIPGVDIGAVPAWNRATGTNVAQSPIIAFLDSGNYRIDDASGNTWINLPELAGATGIDDDNNGCIDDRSGCNVGQSGTPTGDIGSPFNLSSDQHGALVQSFAAGTGNNAVGTSGVLWSTRALMVKISDNATGSITDINIIRGINYLLGLLDRGEKIVAVNMSWGGPGYSASLNDALNQLASRGVVLVAAAGNGGADSIGDNNDLVPHYPSSFTIPNLISVAATDNRGALGSFSNFGLTSVDIGAPGVLVEVMGRTASGASSRFAASGTSFAAPLVTGAVGLIKNAYPHLTAAQVKQSILQGAVPATALAGRSVTGGTLNLDLALQLAATFSTPTPTPSATPTATPTPTLTPTPTITPTPTPSMTPTPTATPTVTGTPTATGTPTPRPSPSTTQTPVSPVIVAPSESPSPSPSSSSTPSASPSPSPSSTPTPGGTASPTPSATIALPNDAAFSLAMNHLTTIRAGIATAQSPKPKKAKAGRQLALVTIRRLRELTPTLGLASSSAATLSGVITRLEKAVEAKEWKKAKKLAKAVGEILLRRQ